MDMAELGSVVDIEGNVTKNGQHNRSPEQFVCRI